MRADHGEADGERRDQQRSDAGDEDDDDGEHDEADERLGVGEGPSEEDQRLVGGLEEVEEGPGGEERDEDKEREGVREEREPEDEGHEGGVIDAEVAEVLADPGVGVGEGLRPREGAPVEQLHPRAALREPAADGAGQPREERPERRRGYRRLRAASGGRGGLGV